MLVGPVGDEYGGCCLVPGIWGMTAMMGWTTYAALVGELVNSFHRETCFFVGRLVIRLSACLVSGGLG